MGARTRNLPELIRTLGLFAGPIGALAVFLILPPAVRDSSGELVSGLPHPARATAALATLMAIWWLTEAIHITATAILPLALLPLLGVMGIRDAAAPYAHPILFLFFGGFILGLAMEKSGLHKRIALITIRIVGDSPARIILGFMTVCFLMSAWVSNTATTLLMLPIAISVITLLGANDNDNDPHRPTTNIARCLLLGIAYASSIGGTTTLVGTAPNIFLAGYLRDEFATDLSMVSWLIATTPIAAVYVLLVWAVLTRLAHPIRGARAAPVADHVRQRLQDLGPPSRAEWTAFTVFCLTAAAWITRPLIQRAGGALIDAGYTIPGAVLSSLQDATIAMLAACALFVIPVRNKPRDFAMDWPTAERGVPWGILILLGGGFSLASAVTSTGLDTAIARSLGFLAGAPDVLIILIVVAVIVFLTELTSNTATTTALIPVLGAAAPALGIEPVRLLVPAAIAASYAFMLPVATPPNAIVFGSGRLRIHDMAKAGIWLNILGIAVAMLAGYAVERVLALTTA